MTMEQGQRVLTNAREAVKDARTLCKRTWWVFLIGGIASVVFGILAFMNPGAALLVLGMFFAAYVLVDGAVNIWGAVTHRDKDGWWAILLLGIVGVLIGGYALVNPPVSMIALVFLVAFMAIFMGVLMLSLGWRVRKAISGEWMLYLTGGLSVLFGLMIFLRPAEGTISVVWLIASWAILIGVLRIVFALKVRKLPERVGDKVRAAVGGSSAV
jgi:uncharacterized membrane protein HdeD (DUF308 family)